MIVYNYLKVNNIVIIVEL